MASDAEMWDKARRDLVSGMIELAASAKTERELDFVRSAAEGSISAGLLSPEDGAEIDALASARLDLLHSLDDPEQPDGQS